MNRCKYSFILVLFVLFTKVSTSQNNYLIKAKSYFIIDSNIYYGQKHLHDCLNNVTNSKQKIEAYDYLIYNYLNKEKYTKARNLVFEMLHLAKKLNDKEMEYVAIGLFGDVEKLNKNYAVALNYYLKSYDLLEKNKNWDYLCKCAIDLVELNRAIANYKDAEVYIKKTFNIFYTHKLKDLTILARLYNRIAAVKNETGTMELIDSSIIYSKKALLINQQLNNLNDQAITWNELGYSYRHLKKVDTSEICFMKAENIWVSIGADNYAVNAMNNRAALYGSYNFKSNERIAIYTKIIAIVKQKNIVYDIYLVFKGLSEEYFRLHDLKNALHYYQLYHQAYEKKLEQIYFTQIDEIKEKYENDKITKEISQVSSKLNVSQISLQQKKRENKIIYISLCVLGLLLLFIGYLLFKNKKINAALNQKNIEKDGLIQEVHHRVKNNLQFIAAMLKMQINSIKDESNQVVLKETSRRISAMSLVHEMLYNKEKSATISAKDYLGELVSKLNELVYDNRTPITFHLSIEDVKFDINNCVAIGMITSEIISNAIKYAFVDSLNPAISLSLNFDSAQKNIVFSIQDNGIGLISNSNTSGLGLRLIDIFSRQLEAEYDSKNDYGLKYTFTIPYDKKQ